MMDYKCIDMAIVTQAFEKKAGFWSGAAESLRKGFGAATHKELQQSLNRARRASHSSGPESFLTDILMTPFSKKTRAKVRGAQWKYVSKPSLITDTAIGHQLSRIPGAKGLFTIKEQVPVGPNLHKTVERASALAPLVKVRNIAVPIFAGMGITEALSKKDRKTPVQDVRANGMIDSGIKTAMDTLNPELREKVASTMLQLNSKNKGYEKQAQAIKLMYKQAELGISMLPSTYAEFNEKVASISRQDLTVLEKALELAAGDVKLGELSGSDPTSYDPTVTFQSAVLE